MTPADRYAPYLALAGLAFAALGWLLAPRAFYGAWLAATVFLAGWPLGSLALLLTHSLTGGRWGDAFRPAFITGLCSLPILLLAILPLLPGLPALYPWARPAAHLANAFYLNTPFFALRGILYAIVWLTTGALTLRALPRPAALGRLAPPALVLLALTTTFAAIDTTMSLDPAFTSSIYGMIAAAGMALLALSAATLLTATAAGPELRDDFGRLILALVILWTYLDFMQLLIVWQSDLAADAPWYLARFRGFWGAVAVAVILGHFALPSALLLSPRLRRSRRAITAIAILLIAMAALRAWWTVLPALAPAAGFAAARGLGWIAFAAMVGLPAAAFCFARWAVRRPFAARALHV